MLSFCRFGLRLNSQLKIVLETKTAVNRLIKRPRISVTAKPRIGPEPVIYRIKEEMMVVTCVSMIVTNARSKPIEIDSGTLIPSLNSSRIRSNISTFESTAIPMPRIRPAIPGRVKVDLINIRAAIVKIIFNINATTALIPEPR